MCMKNYNADKIIFDKFTAFFNIAIFFTIAYTIMVGIFTIAYTIMVGSAYFVKSTPPRAFSISFQ